MNVAKCDPLHDLVHKKPENRGKVLRGNPKMYFIYIICINPAPAEILKG